jgi:ornithine carbamoyltransferase
MTHFLSVEKSNREELLRLLGETQQFKAMRGQSNSLLNGQTWALIFNKPSTRTRVSFEVGLRELGANVIFLSQNELRPNLSRSPAMVGFPPSMR